MDEVRKHGIYFWTVPLAEGHLIHYVRETGTSLVLGVSLAQLVRNTSSSIAATLKLRQETITSWWV